MVTKGGGEEGEGRGGVRWKESSQLQVHVNEGVDGLSRGKKNESSLSLVSSKFSSFLGSTSSLRKQSKIIDDSDDKEKLLVV